MVHLGVDYEVHHNPMDGDYLMTEDTSELGTHRTQKQLEDAIRTTQQAGQRAAANSLNMMANFWQPLLGQPALPITALWARAFADGVEAATMSISKAMQAAAEASQNQGQGQQQDQSYSSSQRYGSTS